MKDIGTTSTPDGNTDDKLSRAVDNPGPAIGSLQRHHGALAEAESAATLSSPKRSTPIDLHSLQYIAAMAHDLKKMASRSGLRRVALILEMAELEALDQQRRSEA
jgi:hypothetical protein